MGMRPAGSTGVTYQGLEVQEIWSLMLGWLTGLDIGSITPSKSKKSSNNINPKIYTPDKRAQVVSMLSKIITREKKEKKKG